MNSLEYERFADIYSIWTATAASAQANQAFYVDAYLATDGPVVELGVGDGRLAVEAARRGCAMVGVDLSPAMLELCRARAERAGVIDRLTLLQADFRAFTLAEPAALIALPYHSLGHLLTLDAKREAIRHIHAQLRPGGRFVFDDFVVTPERLDRLRQVQLRATYRTAGGSEALLWVTSLVDEASQSMRVVTWEDELDADNSLHRRRYRFLSLSWLDPAEARQLLEQAGFTIESCYGNFDRTPFAAATAAEQIWVARKEMR
jgi:SAM-dependent methyltransferase